MWSLPGACVSVDEIIRAPQPTSALLALCMSNALLHLLLGQGWSSRRCHRSFDSCGATVPSAPAEVIVIDEIGTEAECLAARTIAQRGVQLVATAHGGLG